MSTKRNDKVKGSAKHGPDVHGALAVQKHMFTRLSDALEKRKSVVRLVKKLLAVLIVSLALTLIMPILLAYCSRRYRGVLAVLTAVLATILFFTAGASVHGLRILSSLGKDIKWLEGEIECLED